MDMSTGYGQPAELNVQQQTQSNDLQQLKDKAVGAANRAKGKATDAAQRAMDTFDGKRPAVADTLDSAASVLQKQADNVSNAAHRTADYARRRDARGMLRDVETLMREHPAACLLTAATAGFLFARGMRRRRRTSAEE